MRIDIITVLPELLENFTQESIVGRAQKKGLVEIHIHNLRDYSTNRWRRVDDYPFGGFAGMVMQCQPIDACISELTSQRHYTSVSQNSRHSANTTRSSSQLLMGSNLTNLWQIHFPWQKISLFYVGITKELIIVSASILLRKKCP